MRARPTSTKATLPRHCLHDAWRLAFTVDRACTRAPARASEVKTRGGRHPDRVTRVPAAGSAEVEPVEAHDLVPGGGEVADELLAGVVGGVDLRQRSKLRVGAEDQVGSG